MDNASKARLLGCHPILVARVQQLEQLLDFGLEVVQGNRTFNLQAALFAQGREPLAVVNDMRSALALAPLTDTENVVVTKAQPGWGWHEYGCAVDVAPLDQGTIDWNVNHPDWQKILAVAPTCGLAEGAQWRSFPDNPHLYPNELPPTPGADIRQAWAEGGKTGVWSILPGDLQSQASA